MRISSSRDRFGVFKLRDCLLTRCAHFLPTPASKISTQLGALRLAQTSHYHVNPFPGVPMSNRHMMPFVFTTYYPRAAFAAHGHLSPSRERDEEKISTLLTQDSVKLTRPTAEYLTFYSRLVFTSQLTSNMSNTSNATLATATQSGSLFASSSPLVILLWFETIAACFS